MSAPLPWTTSPGTLLPALIDKLEQDQAPAHTLDKRLLRLYYGRAGVPASSEARRDVRRNPFVMSDEVRLGGRNLVANVIDTAESLAASAPAIKVQTVGETFSRQKSARGMSRFINGVFYANHFEEKASDLFLDGCTTRKGFVKWFIEEDEIKVERVEPLSVLWDDTEGQDPRTLHQVSYVSKRRLAALYPALAAEIDGCKVVSPPALPGLDVGVQDPGDRTRAIESWMLPLGDEKGRHVIVAGNVVLLDEEYKFRKHCLVGYAWKRSYRSFGGTPLAQALEPYQYWRNYNTLTIGQAHEACKPRQMIHENSEVEDLGDKVLGKVRWKGQIMPTIVTSQALPPEFYTWDDKLEQGAFAEAGVNINAASGTVDASEDASGAAINARTEMVSVRLKRQIKAFSNVFRESAEIVVMLAGSMSKAAKVKSPGTKMLDEIDWNALKPLKEHEYSVQVQTISATGLTPSARISFAKQLSEMTQGAVKAGDVLRMIGVPDLEAVIDRETAFWDLAERQVEAAVWEGEYMPVSPYQPPDILADIAKKEYVRWELNGTIPEAHMELLRRLIAEAEKAMKPAAPPAGAAPMLAPLTPPGAPPPAAAPPPPPPGGMAPPAGDIAPAMAA